MLIHNADITGSLTINGIPYNSGSFSGSFQGDGSQLSGVTSYTDADTLFFIQGYSGSYSGSFFGDGSNLTGVTSYTDADTLDFINSLNVVSGSIESVSTVSDTFTSVTSYTVTHNFGTKEVIVSVYENDTLIFPSSINTPTTNTVTITFPEPVTGRVVVVKAGHIVSGSINYDSVLNKPTLVSGSSQISFTGITNKPTLVSGSSQVSFTGITNKPTLISGSAQIAAFGYATTGSNQFKASQVITGSLTVTGAIVAQTLNVQEVTSSIVFSSGSNIFGNDLGNTQQFTGSVSITGSLTVNGSGLVPYTGATANVNLEGRSITSAMVYISGLNTGGEGGVLNLKKGSTRVIGGTDAANTISVWADGTTLGFNDVVAGNVRSAKFSVASITNNATRTYTLPNADGTLALTSNLSDYLPLTGGTLTGALNGTSAAFSGYITGAGNNPGGLGGSRYVLDWVSGQMRLFSYGANSSTNGGFLFNSQRSDGTNSINYLDISSTGAATFSSSVTAAGITSIATSKFGSSTNFVSTFADGSGVYFENTGTTTATRTLRIQGLNDAGNAYSQFFINHGAGNYRFVVNDQDRVRIDGDGLKFNGDTAAANALDDYEEGTWTPTSVSGGLTFSIQVARYTKVGRLVTAQCYVTMPTGGNTSEVVMGGLPFTNLANGWAPGALDVSACSRIGGVARVAQNSTTIGFIVSSGSTSLGRFEIQGNEFGNDSYIILTVTYQTS
jgi:hypothetical protein